MYCLVVFILSDIDVNIMASTFMFGACCHIDRQVCVCVSLQLDLFLCGRLFLKPVITHWPLITCHVTVICVSDNYRFETQWGFTRALLHALTL